jgi:hypothetical protein
MLTILSTVSFCQTWPKIFTDEENSSNGLNIWETYDGGIVFLARSFNGQRYLPGWIVKTDINGEFLWHRNLLFGDTLSIANHMITTSDSGLLIFIRKTYFDPDLKRDQAYMKLNACGQIEWCKIISNSDQSIWTNNVIEVEGGYVGMTVSNIANNHFFSLTKLDYDGNIKWMFNYDNEEVNSEIYAGISALNDGNFVVTGSAHSNTTDGYKPIRIYISPEGEMIDYSLMYPDVDTVRGMDSQIYQSLSGKIFSVGSTFLYSEISYFDPYSSLRIGNVNDNYSPYFLFQGGNLDSFFTGISAMSDNSLAITGYIFENNTLFRKYSAYIFDTLGSVLHQRELLQHFEGIGLTMSTTSDNKILLTGSCGVNNPWGFPEHNTLLFKLNAELEDDSLYTASRIYDYACGEGLITYDTLYMDGCEVVTNSRFTHKFADNEKIEVYPNPVTEKFFVHLPEFVSIHNKNNGGNALTRQSNYQQYSILQIYDINGRLIDEQKLSQGQQVVSFNASKWAKGIYLLRLVYKGKTVGNAKVLK